VRKLPIERIGTKYRELDGSQELIVEKPGSALSEHRRLKERWRMVLDGSERRDGDGDSRQTRALASIRRTEHRSPGT
jgi:hypothetical protein